MVAFHPPGALLQVTLAGQWRRHASSIHNAADQLHPTMWEARMGFLRASQKNQKGSHSFIWPNCPRPFWTWIQLIMDYKQKFHWWCFTTRMVAEELPTLAIQLQGCWSPHNFTTNFDSVEDCTNLAQARPDREPKLARSAQLVWWVHCAWRTWTHSDQASSSMGRIFVEYTPGWRCDRITWRGPHHLPEHVLPQPSNLYSTGGRPPNPPDTSIRDMDWGVQECLGGSIWSCGRLQCLPCPTWASNFAYTGYCWHSAHRSACSTRWSCNFNRCAVRWIAHATHDGDCSCGRHLDWFLHSFAPCRGLWSMQGSREAGSSALCSTSRTACLPQRTPNQDAWWIRIGRQRPHDHQRWRMECLCQTSNGAMTRLCPASAAWKHGGDWWQCLDGKTTHQTLTHILEFLYISYWPHATFHQQRALQWNKYMDQNGCVHPGWTCSLLPFAWGTEWGVLSKNCHCCQSGRYWGYICSTRTSWGSCSGWPPMSFSSSTRRKTSNHFPAHYAPRPWDLWEERDLAGSLSQISKMVATHNHHDIALSHIESWGSL